MPFGKAAIRRPGKHITIVANLLMWYKAMQAAEELEKEGISCEIIDPRSLVPFDHDTVLESLEKTGKLMSSTRTTTTAAGAHELRLLCGRACHHAAGCSVDCPRGGA